MKKLLPVLLIVLCCSMLFCGCPDGGVDSTIDDIYNKGKKDRESREMTVYGMISTVACLGYVVYVLKKKRFILS